MRTPSAALLEAQRLLADGLPFHAHEVLEDAWKAAPPTERELWRGLAQLAVAATHAARGNRAGALALLERGAAAMSPYRTTGVHDLDIDSVLSWVDSAITMVGARVPVRLPPPPLVPHQR